jgi:pimeloyl-ACP methyl ester carboxylesterase
LRLVYLHGFASGPGSTKSRFFQAKLAERGATLVVPELAPDFTHLTVSSMLAIVEPLIDGPSIVMGSSLGGYMATLAAARAPERVRGLVLFAPAFGFAERWQQSVGAKALARWREKGTAPIYHYGLEREVPLAFDLFDDAAGYDAEPDPEAPALVFHGRHDDAVPLAAVEHFALARAGRELVVYDSGHDLNDVLEPMWVRTQDFLRRFGIP